jgi:hypothetical protein
VSRQCPDGFVLRSDACNNFFVERAAVTTSNAEKSAQLTLIRANKSHPSGEWSDDNYDVFHGDRHIGRIFLHPQAPAGRPWFWSITVGEAKSSIFNKGYSASREQAMMDFKAQWIKRRIDT